jgi:sulfate transport system ATP-binding protein
MDIEIRDLTHAFGAFKVLDEVSLDVPSGELLALLGPSGCGKTTLLRLLAGLARPDAGSIRIGGEDVTRQEARSRRVGLVFQHYALFRHMSVFENIAFGLRVRGRRERPSRAAIRERVAALLALVKLEGFGDRMPAELSGGQRQRVALARALAVEPRILLLDEPFGALDANVRRELRRWLRRLHEEIRLTSVFVTHDVEEAMEVAGRVAVMDRGRIVQTGPPEEVYAKPANPFVCSFLGSVNIFPAVADGSGAWTLLPAPAAAGNTAPAAVFARPHELLLSRAPGPPGRSVAAEVVRVQAVGATVRIELRRCDSGQRLEAELSRERQAALRARAGERLFARPARFRCFAEKGGTTT